MQQISVGLVGCGGAGKGIHMRLFGMHADRYRVVACADTLPASAEALAGEFGLRALPVEALLTDPAVELVVVATKPPVTHRDLALRAFAAGKHVVVEKPMAGTSAECREMIDAARAAGRILAVHHNRRWDVDFLTARTIIASGALGEMRLVRNEYTAGFSGSAYDWGIHLVDQTMALSFGLPFTELTAAYCTPHPDAPAESDGFFTCRLRAADGVLHDLSMLPTFAGNAFKPGMMPYRFMLMGTQGAVYQEWCQRPEDAFGKSVAMQPASGRPLGDLPFVRASLAISDFYQMLHSAIRDGGPVPVTGEDGCRAVRAWELIGQSACEGRTLTVEL
jgi:scyllo-inositol 2-dehydrogenase (NADP+)